jgi:alpha-beta hydrolase superfamily lysophospholipase
MSVTTGLFEGAGGIELYYRCRRPEGDARAVLAIVHGHGEHSGRYEKIADFLVARGIAVCGFDHRGHGRSRGQRGHIDSWAQYRADTAAFLRLMGKLEPRCPVFLMGHSMGALVALDYLIHDSKGIRGAIISGAPIEPAGVTKTALVIMSRTLSRLFPRFPMNLSLDTSALSRDAAVVRAYIDDPLVHGKISARWGTEALAAVARVRARATELSVPVLFVHGEADRLNLLGGIREFFERVSSRDKSLRIYPEMYHELHNDFGFDSYLSDLERWLTEHL